MTPAQRKMSQAAVKSICEALAYSGGQGGYAECSRLLKDHGVDVSERTVWEWANRYLVTPYAVPGVVGLARALGLPISPQTLRPDLPDLSQLSESKAAPQ